jgi:anaerobic magnesium-protoporphyrin IX monomethyl ester cyclase
LAAVLEKNGSEVAVIDSPALHMTYKNVEKEIKRLEPDMVGITSVTATYTSALKVARIVKEAYPQALVVFGGPHVTIVDDQTVIEHPEVDVVVRGEGEQTIAEIAQSVSGTLSMDEIAGITFRKDGQVVRTPERSCIENLDELPYPAYNYFPLTKYRIFGKLGLPMVTSRGCPSQCAFCLVPRIAGRRFRARTPQNVVNELEWLRVKYHPDFISFNDEVFTYEAKRVLDICSEIRHRNIKLPWDCQTRVDLVSKELLYHMKAANCQLISFGVESGSQEILTAMKKGTTVQQNATAIKWAKEAGLSVTASLIIGYPGETKKTMQQTVDFIKKTEPDDIYLFLATPYPSTELRDTVIDLGWKMSRDWNEYEMQTPTFENIGLPFEKINSIRETFYNQLYSPSYILKQSLKKTIYSRIMLQNGLHQLLWRIKLPWLSANFKKLLHM